ALKAAEESTVLLKNQQNTLPLSPNRTILVAGSSAGSVANQMGGWTIGWQGIPPGQNPPAITILQGIRRAVAGHGRVLYTAGTSSRQVTTMAKRASAAVVVVG